MLTRSLMMATALSAAFGLSAVAQTAPSPASPTQNTAPAAPSGGMNPSTAPANPGSAGAPSNRPMQPGAAQTAPSANPAGGSTMSAGQSDMFYTGTITPAQKRGSDLMNVSVYTRNNENIGEVEDIILDEQGKVTAVVVGVGGFLGLGQRNVAINYSAMNITREDDGDLKVMVDTTRDQLRQAPEFKLDAANRT